MENYYAIVRSGDHLAHYGVKGMQWGVRKAIKKGSERKLDRQYRKAAKKLAKLNAKADINVQSDRAKKYGKAMKVAAGVGLSGIGMATGSKILSSKLLKSSNKHAKSAESWKNEKDRIIGRINDQRNKTKALNWEDAKRYKEYGITREEAIRRTDNWNRNIVDRFADKDIERERAYYDPQIKYHNDTSSAHARGSKIANTAHKIAGGIGAAGLVAAAITGGKSAMAKYRTTKRGHAKAVAKRDAWQKEMRNAFKGTKYSGLPKQTTKKRRK